MDGVAIDIDTISSARNPILASKSAQGDVRDTRRGVFLLAQNAVTGHTV